jgi:hypothetical protein
MTAVPAPYADFPYYGRYDSDHAHAPFLIVRSLVRLGLADWCATLLHWLGRFDGLEQHLDDCDEPDPALDPVCCVRDLLAQHTLRWSDPPEGARLTPEQRHERKQAIVADLLDLKFVAAYAYWRSPEAVRSIWDPFNEDWLWFIQTGPDASVILQMKEGEECAELRTDTCTANEEDREYLNATRDMLLRANVEERA